MDKKLRREKQRIKEAEKMVRQLKSTMHVHIHLQCTCILCICVVDVLKLS